MTQTTPATIATCGTCGLSWNDAAVTSMTPAPAGRCPFEAFHDYRPGTLHGRDIPDSHPVQPTADAYGWTPTHHDHTRGAVWCPVCREATRNRTAGYVPTTDRVTYVVVPVICAVDDDGAPVIVPDLQEDGEPDSLIGDTYTYDPDGGGEWTFDPDAQDAAYALIEQMERDRQTIDRLTDFARTPEWSVSMLEDIAEIIRDARGDLGADYDPDDPRAFQRH